MEVELIFYHDKKELWIRLKGDEKETCIKLNEEQRQRLEVEKFMRFDLFRGVNNALL